MNDPVKWGLLDLLRILDGIHGGRWHAEFARIAATLGVILPMPPVPSEDDDVLPPSRD